MSGFQFMVRIFAVLKISMPIVNAQFIREHFLITHRFAHTEGLIDLNKYIPIYQRLQTGVRLLEDQKNSNETLELFS